jgi:hypothetical protein
VIAERRDATSGRADERRKAAADLRAELQFLARLGDRHDDDVVEADDMHSEHRHVEGLPMRSSTGCARSLKRLRRSQCRASVSTPASRE